MKLKDSIKMSFNDLKNRKFRTFITCFSVSIGVALIIIMSSLGQGLKNWAKTQANTMNNLKTIAVSPKEDGKKQLNKDTISEFKKIKGVVSLSSRLNSTITSTNLNNKSTSTTSIIGIDLKNKTFLNSDIEIVKSKNKNGSPILYGKDLDSTSQNEALVGEVYLKRLGIKDFKNALNKTIKLNLEIPNKRPLSISLKIKGIINKSYKVESRKIIVPLDIAEKFNNYAEGLSTSSLTGKLSSVVLETNNMNDTEKVASKVKSKGFEASTNAKQIKQSKSQMDILNALLIAGGVIVLLVSSIGVVNTMSMAVYEKTKSIGIMKALGASKKNIKGIFLVQSASLGFLGGLLGFIIYLIAYTSLDKYLVNMISKKGSASMDSFLVFNPTFILIAILLATIISMIAGLIPSSKAAKLDPVETLSYE
ncbi:ABC transporter permease [Clostridium oceanicum]|uniref:ABC transporter permease n=1 Tax=Clostridium oceanicum TaxID=1543 RepID=A0ABP3UT08_9CLOT